MQIEHIVVLMMENRSFDHFLGYLDHPSEEFPRLNGTESNDYNGQSHTVSKFAEYEISHSPGHKHKDVMEQLYNGSIPENLQPNNAGFISNFSNFESSTPERIMLCFSPEKLPILSTLAKKYAVCTNWFCSVPGATWPNRHFAHTGHSRGKADNPKNPVTDTFIFDDETIFNVIEDAGKKWNVFHDGVAHTEAFRKLWKFPLPLRRFRSMKTFYKKARKGKLPSYSFIEPNHIGSDSNSFHPHYIDDGDVSFASGERLIKNIYEAISKNKKKWPKTLFLITFDEHGGFFDRQPPPPGIPPLSPNKDDDYHFMRLGPRVPAIVISPWIPEGTVDTTEYDHSSIVSTLRETFAPTAEPMSKRDEVANRFTVSLTLSEPRIDEVTLPDVPDISPELLALRKSQPVEMDDFQASLIHLNNRVANEIQAERTQRNIDIDALQEPEVTVKSLDSFKTYGDVDEYNKVSLQQLSGRGK